MLALHIPLQKVYTNIYIHKYIYICLFRYVIVNIPSIKMDIGALQTLTFGLARESARDGITVNAIAPAYLRTSTLEHYPPEIVERLLETIPVGRFCEPEEYAHTVRFLISPLAGFITGEVIDMNGGLLMD